MRSGPDQRPRDRFNGNRPFQQQPRRPQNNQSFDSSNSGTRIRGSAYQIFERYLALAREAATGGDRVAAENFYQHAEHYFRVNNAGDRYSPETSRQVDPAPIKTGIATTELNELELEREQPRMNANQPGL